MSVTVNFTPAVGQVFSFQPTIGGTVYTCDVLWNHFAQRYYIQLTDLSGNLVLLRPLVGSGTRVQAALTWAQGVASATLASPHEIPVGQVVPMRVTGTGSSLDGNWQVVSTGPSSFDYSVATGPTQAQPIPAMAGFNVNLVAGFLPGYLLFFNETQQFESVA